MPSTGIAPRGVVVLDVATGSYLETSERRRLLDRALLEVRGLPGVRSAGMTQRVPLRGKGWSAGITLDGSSERDLGTTYFRFVTPGYFETLGMTLRDGQLFNESDAGSGELRVIINTALAKKYFAGVNPIGRRVGGMGAPRRIVGVVSNAAEGALTDPPAPTRYLLEQQSEFLPEAMTLVVRTARAGDEAAVMDQARRTIERVAPQMAVLAATTMRRVLDVAVGPARQIMSLLALLAGLALVLGSIGVYGVIAHFANRRSATGRSAWRSAFRLPGS